MSSSVCLTNKLHYLNKDSLTWIVETLLRRVYPEKSESGLTALLDELLSQKALAEMQRVDDWAAAPIAPSAPLSELELDPRTYNCIRRYRKILTVGDLIGYTSKELQKIPGLGNHCLENIEKQLEKKGLSLMDN